MTSPCIRLRATAIAMMAVLVVAMVPSGCSPSGVPTPDETVKSTRPQVGAKVEDLGRKAARSSPK